ncbi:hypothetical protein DL764_007066 [Monosporascus ibericus]|uniref:DNA replication regulator Sld3 C-terminal domain-containing protein n=1 Tax=Monosporascus ibericus TaxID=155417 RepID=A0A4Q4T6L2_9PEZI|nr:hypothetical protein DL764_007066 [Monosporascus ibericus]
MSSRISVLGGSSDASRPPSRATTATPSTSRRPSLLKPTSGHRLKADGNHGIAIEPRIKPRSLQPLILLPREHLHLSFLDLHSPYGSFESSRYFESKIKILDLEGRVAAHPVVLIARLESDKTIYALERQNNGLYSLCHLCSWVNLEKLCELSTVSCGHLIKKSPPQPIDSGTSQPLITSQLHEENKKRKLAIEAIQSLVKKPARSRSVSTPSQPVELITQPAAPAGDEDATSRQSGNGQASQDAALFSSIPDAKSKIHATAGARIYESQSQPAASDIFDSIRNQYIEALYHSMGSLAYFAKGPLSRARAAFHLDCDSALEMNDLIDFLKSLVMTTVQIDKKYRETLPDIISKMKPVMQDSDNEQSSSKAKKRKVKKMKLGKDGLYPGEDEHVRKWWGVHKPEPKDDDKTTTSASPHDAKVKLFYLRSRETQLQMIIILEILALEPLRTPDDAADSQLPGMPGAAEADGEALKPGPPKKRNRHNFPFLLDVHADRLCIWQSTALDEVKMMDDSQIGQISETQKSLRATSDPLKDFCVDVIVPLLPEQCDSLNRKLGGPVMATPAKAKPKRPESAVKPKPRPGSAVKRPALVKSVKPLDKVLSKESERHRRSMSRGPSGIIALMRSASTPRLKREASEPLSATTVLNRGTPGSNETTPMSAGSGPIKRRSDEEKAKKEAMVKAELQDAISALRRPNRDVVGKAMAEAAERRATTTLSQLKKSKKSTQHPRLPNVVKATPVAARFRDALAKDAHSQPAGPTHTGWIEADNFPPSSASLIPSSAPRKRNRDAAFGLGDESPALPAASRVFNNNNGGGHHHVEAHRPSAPRHADFLSVPGTDDEAILVSSPVAARRIAQPKFAMPMRRPLVAHDDSGIGMPTSPGGLAETPRKPRSDPLDSVAATPVKATVVSGVRAGGGSTAAVPRPGDNNAAANGAVVVAKEKENNARRVSIYEKLGWDDDSDELG